MQGNILGQLRGAPTMARVQEIARVRGMAQKAFEIAHAFAILGMVL